MKPWIFILYFILEFHCYGQYYPERLISELEKYDVNSLSNFQIPTNYSSQDSKELRLIIKSIISSKNNNLRVRMDCLMTLADDQNPTSNFAKTYSNYHLGCLLILYDLSDIAKKHNLKAVSFAKKTNNLPLLFYSYRNIAGIHFVEKKFELAKQFYQKSNQSSSENFIAETASNLNNIGMCEIELKNYNRAIKTLKLGLKMIQDDSRPFAKEVKYLILGNLGTAHSKKKQNELAQHYLDIKLKYYRRQHKISIDKLECLLDLESLHYNSPILSQEYTNELLQDLDRIPNQRKKHEFISYYLRTTKAKLTTSVKSSMYRMQLLSGQNSLLKQNKTQYLILSTLYNSRVQSLSKNLTLEKKQKFIQEQSNRYKNLLVIGLIIITIVVIYFLKKQQKTKLKAIQQDAIIQEQINKLAETNQRLLEKKVSQQNSELQSLMTNLKIKHEIENTFLLKIKELKKNKNSTIDAVITEMQLNINNLKEIDRKLVKNSFKDHTINNEFTTKLEALHPNLTQEEIEYCHYFISKLSAKEIGQITNHTDGTIRVIKHKIKQKLGLNREDSMVDYLEKVS